MATDLNSHQDASVTTLVTGIVQDAQELLKQQFELFKHELRTEVQNLKIGVQVLSAGMALTLVGGILLGFTVVQGLQAAFPELPLWACYAISCGVFVPIGGGLLLGGWLKLQSVNPLPDQSAQALKENIQWKMKPR